MKEIKDRTEELKKEVDRLGIMRKIEDIFESWSVELSGENPAWYEFQKEIIKLLADQRKEDEIEFNERLIQERCSPQDCNVLKRYTEKEKEIKELKERFSKASDAGRHDHENWKEAIAQIEQLKQQLSQSQQDAKREVFDDLEKHPDWKRLGLYMFFKEIKKKHIKQSLKGKKVSP